MEFPVYDKSESINAFIRRVEAFKQQISKTKYNIILNFINELLSKQYESLTMFKNVKESIIMKKFNVDIIKKYYPQFKSNFTNKFFTNELPEIIDVKFFVQLLRIATNEIDYAVKLCMINMTYSIYKK